MLQRSQGQPPDRSHARPAPGEAAGEEIGRGDHAPAIGGALPLHTAQRRADARRDQDWAGADDIRDRLKQAGIDVTDTADGPQWALADGEGT